MTCCGIDVEPGYDGTFYEFCPRCGRRTCRLGPTDVQSVTLNPAESEFEVAIENVGPGILTYSLVRSSEIFEVLGSGLGRIAGHTSATIRLKFVGERVDVARGSVTISVNDAERLKWYNRDNVREQILPVDIYFKHPGKIITPVRSLLFSDSYPTQTLRLVNVGDYSSHAVLTAPDGYLLSAKGSSKKSSILTIHIEPNSDEPVIVTSTKHQLPVNLEISTGERNYNVTLSYLQARVPLASRPDYVVGIDFGTRNTSVYIRDCNNDDDTAAVTSIFDKERFPSALFINPSAPEATRIGDDALSAWNSSVEPSSFLVESIKTLVRLEDESYTKFGREWTVLKLLEKYLTELRRLIELRMEAAHIPQKATVLYAFTLPVLDHDALYERQESRMAKAAATAWASSNPSQFLFLSEPEAAAIHVAKALPRLAKERIAPAGIQPGAKICVVDAGGGTTDVCIGRIDADSSGKWSFTALKSLALTQAVTAAQTRFLGLLYPAARRQLQQFNQVGGNTLDQEIAYRAIASMVRIDNVKPHFIAEPWIHLYKQIGTEFLQVENFLNGIKFIKEELSANPFMPLNLSEENEGEYELQRIFDTPVEPAEVLSTLSPVMNYDEDIAPVVTILWEDENVGKALQAAVEEMGGCELVVPIGGTTRLPEFQRQIAEYTDGELLLLPGDDRLTAVAQGAVWAFDARMEKMLSVDLSLSLDVNGNPSDIMLLKPYQPITSMDRYTESWPKIQAGDTIRLVVNAGRNGTRTALAEWEFVALDDQDHFAVSAVSSDDDGVKISVQSSRLDDLVLWEVRA